MARALAPVARRRQGRGHEVSAASAQTNLGTVMDKPSMTVDRGTVNLAG
jgi:hypothetical protein